MTWLHASVPAEYETRALNPAAFSAPASSLTGSVEKYAAGPFSSMGASGGQSRLIATRSMEKPGLKPS